MAGTHSWLGYLCVRQSDCSLDPLSLLRRVSGSAEVAGSDSASLLEHFVETLALRLETWSFLCLRLMIWAGVILALRLDSSGIKKGEFRTGHPQTLNKNAVAPFMNSRCQVLHPQIYFLLWFLFKKGCACVMSSSWWGLTAQHYATKINHMLCRNPWHGTVRSSTWGQPCFRILHIVPESVCLSVWQLSSVWTGTGFAAFFLRGQVVKPVHPDFLSKACKIYSVRMLWCPLGQSCALAVTMPHLPGKVSLVSVDNIFH